MCAAPQARISASLRPLHHKEEAYLEHNDDIDFILHFNSV